MHIKKTKPKPSRLSELTARLFFYKDSSSMFLFQKSKLAEDVLQPSRQREEGMLAPFFLSQSYLPGQPLPFHTVGMKMPLTAHHQDILLHQ